MRETLAKRLLGESRCNKYRIQFKYQSCVKEALALSTVPAVHAMHDVAEGGIVAALNEVGRAAN
jgi:hydrogenase maturation factor